MGNSFQTRENGQLERRASCLHCHEKIFPHFVKSSNYRWITGIVITVLLVSFVFTATVSTEHDNLAPKEGVEKLAEELDEIENKQVEVMANQKTLIGNQTDMKKEMAVNQKEINLQLREIVKRLQ